MLYIVFALKVIDYIGVDIKLYMVGELLVEKVAGSFSAPLFNIYVYAEFRCKGRKNVLTRNYFSIV